MSKSKVIKSLILKAARLLMPVIFTCQVSACSIYPNKFKCSEAKGAPCIMLRDVDRQIDSGKIGEIYPKACSIKKRCHYDERLIEK
jgi:hypothetical protein